MTAVSVAYTHLSHHAAHSGYDQVVRHLARHVEVDPLEARVPAGVPWRAWDWADRRWSREWYDVWALSIELAAARRLMGGRRVVHLLYGEDTYRWSGLVRRPGGGALVCTYHQPPALLEELLPPARRLRRLAGVVALDTVQAEHLARRVGDERVHVVPHGVDTGHFRPAPRASDVAPVCLVVGAWLRDFATLGEVVRRLPGVRFEVVSGHEDAGALARHSNVRVRSGIGDHELLAAYQSAGLLVLPLTDCTANNALLEGMACGLPVVASDVGGVRQYVASDGARLVAPRDPDAMAAAIEAVVVDDRRRARMAEASRRRALELDWARVAEQLVEVYEAVR